MESIFQEKPPPWLSYCGPLKLAFFLSLSFSLSQGGFLPWEPEEKLQAHYSCKAGNLRNWGLAEGLYRTTWAEPDFSAPRLFFPLNSWLLPSLNSLPFKI
jgi:hypothetical protein